MRVRSRNPGSGHAAARSYSWISPPRRSCRTIRPTASGAAFTSGHPFFDARDLVQVKYEMLRRARREGQPVSQVAAAFGFSRPSFYAAQALFEQAGLPGLVPQWPGPRRAHKLSEAVVDFLE